MSTTTNNNIAKLAKEYHAAHKAYEKAQKRVNPLFPNIADVARAHVAHRHMVAARQALVDATK